MVLCLLLSCVHSSHSTTHRYTRPATSPLATFLSFILFIRGTGEQLKSCDDNENKIRKKGKSFPFYRFSDGVCCCLSFSLLMSRCRLFVCYFVARHFMLNNRNTHKDSTCFFLLVSAGLWTVSYMHGHCMGVRGCGRLSSFSVLQSFAHHNGHPVCSLHDNSIVHTCILDIYSQPPTHRSLKIHGQTTGRKKNMKIVQKGKRIPVSLSLSLSRPTSLQKRKRKTEKSEKKWK